MSRPVIRANRKPSFFWQGVLILAPVLVLAKIGVFAIWQDKRLARHEAELRAQDVAEEAVNRIWTALQTIHTNPVVMWDGGWAGRVRWATWVKDVDPEDTALQIQLNAA